MLIQISSQSQLLPTTQFLYEDPVTGILEPRVGGIYEDALLKGTVVDSIEDPDTGEVSEAILAWLSTSCPNL